MRPLGHTTARDERAVLAPPQPLEGAWEEFSRAAAVNETNTNAFLHALAILSRAPPALSELESFLLRTDHPDAGIFASAGYQLQPGPLIRYRLHTPYITDFGFEFYGKHLIVDGTLGPNTAHRMIGRLTINGSVGQDSAYAMIGVIDDTPQVERARRIEGSEMMWGPRPAMIGAFAVGRRKGKWNIPCWKRKEFIHGIMNRDRLSYLELRSSIERKCNIESYDHMWGRE
jgi:hypothetical protein